MKKILIILITFLFLLNWKLTYAGETRTFIVNWEKVTVENYVDDIDHLPQNAPVENWANYEKYDIKQDPVTGEDSLVEKEQDQIQPKPIEVTEDWEIQEVDLENETIEDKNSEDELDIWNATSEESWWASSSKIKEWLLNNTSWGSSVRDNWNMDGFSSLTNILVWFKNELTAILSILVIGVFIFIGIRIVSSRWNPEEFKNAMMHFVYTIIWIFLFFIAWWAVKLISSLSF